MRFAERLWVNLVLCVSKRVKVTDAAFGDKKFEYQNLNHIDETRDVSIAYGLAAVQEFIASKSFSSEEILDAHKQKHGNRHNLLFTLVEDWIGKTQQ